jgi:hypothetical protein
MDIAVLVRLLVLVVQYRYLGYLYVDVVAYFISCFCSCLCFIGYEASDPMQQDPAVILEARRQQAALEIDVNDAAHNATVREYETVNTRGPEDDGGDAGGEGGGDDNAMETDGDTEETTATATTSGGSGRKKAKK